MAIYAIGDVQGCYDELARLLELLNPDTARDELWFVGDLVNRGPKSTEVLRLVKSLGPAAVVVLGNHDLHLLACARGVGPRNGEEDLLAVVDAPDGGELTDWLCRQPLAHYRPELNTLMVHAGVAREWDAQQVLQLARDVEQRLRGPQCTEFLAAMYGNEPDRWSDRLTGMARARFIVNCLTRMRYCHKSGRLDLTENGPPGNQPAGLIPWFDLPERGTASVRVVFGHWASLGFLQRDNLLGLDTGCVWGRSLTAARLDGPAKIYSVPSRTAAGRPGQAGT